MIRLCLVGEHVHGSPSAAMQTAALRAARIEGTYELRSLTRQALPAFVAELRGGRYDGCNVTMPHKKAFADRCDMLSADAAAVGAVNTLTVREGVLAGDNTDVAGFARAISVHNLMPAPGATVLVLGSGGAAAAVVLALKRCNPSHVMVAARDAGAVRSMASRLGAVERVAWELRAVRAVLTEVAFMVNATPLDAEFLPVDVHDLPSSCTVADVRYQPRPVRLVEMARSRGLRACDGLEMLLQQGMLSFSIWTGARAPHGAARTALHRAVGA